jgi:RND family efflux transporter MFP subunit
LSGCGDSTSQQNKPKQAPAKVEKHPSESDIYRITLTPKAVERLGISTARIERKAIRRHRTFGGEVAIPVGNSIVVAAPVPGTLGIPLQGSIPPPGSRVEAGQAIFSLVPLLSPERDVPTPAERVQMANARASLVSAQIVAEGDAKQAQAEVDAAQIALRRAERLLQDKAGSARAVDEAKAVLEIAQKKRDAADMRKKVLDSLTLDAEKGELRTVQIVAPERGIMSNLSATRGQTVTTGTPLFEVVNLDTVWIRVPVYVGQLDQIVTTSDAKVGDLKGGSESTLQTAKPIAAPPSADALSSTVDLYYEMSNRNGVLHPGERLGVTLPLKGDSESLVVLTAAVLHDIHGTAWVYERVDAQVFRRRRALVSYTAGDLAVLAAGPEVGTEVVVDGAAELFGTEFGTGK